MPSSRSGRPSTASSPGTIDGYSGSPDLGHRDSAGLVTAPERTVWCEDALPWLERNTPLLGCSVITSLPDVSGFAGLGLPEWRGWFIAAAGLTLSATPDDGVTIFYQTDIKRDGSWVDKSYLCHRAAEQQGASLLWHKIACRKPAGQVNLGRPAYSHL